jgi:hypothetical protein
MGDCGGRSEENNLIRTRTVTVVLMRLQMELRTVLGIGIQAACVTSWQKPCPYFVHTFRFDRRQN